MMRSNLVTQAGFLNFLGLWALGLGTAGAQFSYPGCAPLVDSDFRAVKVVHRVNDPSMAEPVKMAFNLNGRGETEIFFIQRMGKVKFYNPSDRTVTTIGTLSPVTGSEDGLTGIALDPDFRRNNRIFFFYAHSSGFRISRFEIHPTTRMLNPASEKVVMTIPSRRGQIHTAGAMQFDAYGDLWINVGDNRALQLGPSNTRDLRGGILRIHPMEDGTYAIPPGNLWESAARHFESKGMPAVAAQYRDTSRMRRERYVMGTRNPYSLTLDPVRRWATYGDVGPDEMPRGNQRPPPDQWTEEHTVATQPGFLGWPYWTGDRHVQATIPTGYLAPDDGPAEWGDWSRMETHSPINGNPLAGIRDLPPAQPGTHVYPKDAAIAGPIFRYDGALNSTVQLPPHFNRYWFVTDFNLASVKAIKLTPDGRMDGAPVEVFKGLGFSRPLDFQQGPDGALYYLNYSCGLWKQSSPDNCVAILRIEYTGSCRDPRLRLETPASLAAERKRKDGLSYREGRISIFTRGGHAIEILDMGGRRVFARSSEGNGEYAVPDLLRGQRPGVYIVKAAHGEGSWTWKVPFLKD